MKQVLQERIEVRRSIEECFAYLLDFSTIEQWDPGVLRAEKRTPGAPNIGSEFRLLLRLPAGGSSEMSYRLEDVVPNQRLVLTGTGDGIAALDTLQFEWLSNDLTAITYRAELELTNLSSVFKPLIKPVLNQIGKNAVNGLKAALDPDAPPGKRRWQEKIRDHLILPAMPNFGRRGYMRLENKGLSQRMDGKTVVITGPTAGIGLAAASELARLGADLILVGRGQARLLEAKNCIVDFSGCSDDCLQLVQADLGELTQTAAAASKILKLSRKIDVLINNAGVLLNERQTNSAGLEINLTVNFLSPLLLCDRLAPAMDADGRIINVVSGGMYLQGVDLDDMFFEKRAFSGSKSYAAAKRALFVMSSMLNQEVKPAVHAMHPGWAATPGVAKSLPAFDKLLGTALRDARMGADTLVWLASAAELGGVEGGQLWFDRRPQPSEVLPGTHPGQSERVRLAAWARGILADCAEPLRLVEPLCAEAS